MRKMHHTFWKKATFRNNTYYLSSIHKKYNYVLSFCKYISLKLELWYCHCDNIRERLKIFNFLMNIAPDMKFSCFKAKKIGQKVFFNFVQIQSKTMNKLLHKIHKYFHKILITPPPKKASNLSSKPVYMKQGYDRFKIAP